VSTFSIFSASPTYYIKATLVENKTVIKTYQNQAGRFILATNSLDEKTGLARLKTS